MDYTLLGRTGVSVSTLCFGTMTFGREADEETSAKLFEMCLDTGINFFDCADIYAGGRSEEILGKLMAGMRDELVITSKVGMPSGEDRNAKGLSRRYIMRRVETSLKRLGTDTIDVYFCHTYDGRPDLHETLRALDDLVTQGKIRYAGVSNWPAWRTAKALGECDRLGLNSIHVLQPMYSLAKRTAEVEILPMAAEENLGVISYSPLGGGLLTGKYAGTSDAEGRLSSNEMYAERYRREMYHRTAERFTEFASIKGIHPVTLAVAWVKAHPAITAPIIGARNPEQLQPSLEAADYSMTPEEWEDISALTPPVPMATDRDEERSGGGMFAK
ncbi:MAG: aldo/keto reductase [Armatimonadia bacterium]|nr:aldo/keto reductase [Armatimonadia bacterium]